MKILLIYISIIVIILVVILCYTKTYKPKTKSVVFNEKFFYKSTKDFEEKTEQGKCIAANSSIIFSGLARNVEKNIRLNIHRIKNIGKHFKKYVIVIYENDSTDLTTKILKEEEVLDPEHVYIVSEKLDFQIPISFGGRSVKRFEKMSLLRNKNLEILRHNRFSGYDYVFLTDWDYTTGWSLNGFFHSLSFDKDGVSANGMSYDRLSQLLYYDPLAFENEKGERVRNFVGNPKKNNIAKIVRPSFKFGDRITKVNSAFSGGIIYKKYVIDNDEIYYEGNDCEHISFHNNFRRQGYQLYLNPSFIVIR